MRFSDFHQTFSGARGTLFGAALALPLAIGAFAGSSNPAAANDLKPAPTTYQQELDQLDAASEAAEEYALNNVGVGIVLHVGQDIVKRGEGAVEHVSQYFINEFAKRGVEARVFVSPNGDAPGSAATYHIDKYIHGADNGTAVKNLKKALADIPDTIALLKAAKDVAASPDIDAPKTPAHD